MSTSMTIAYLLLPLFALITISAIINPKRYKQVLKDSVEHPALMYIMSIVTIVGGTAIIMYHNVWTNDRTTTITIVGWMMILKGSIRLLFPKTAEHMMLWAANKNTIYL